MADIQTEADVRLLVEAFYQRVAADPMLAPAFLEVTQIEWATHLPRMVQFWEAILLQKQGYRGNPYLKHAMLKQKMPLTPDHFTHWVSVFGATVDALFIGERADFAKQSAAQMGRGLVHNLFGGVKVFTPNL